MRRSVVGFAAVGLIAAVVAAVVGLWLPARQQRRDAAWSAAGTRALARLALPTGFVLADHDGPDQVCSSGPVERCFLGPGAPSSQVAAVRGALGRIASGPVRGRCFAVPLPGSPDSCHLVAPVAGSRLIADLFAWTADPRRPLAQRRYDGTFVLLHIDHS